jgi:hypothetical protein
MVSDYALFPDWSQVVTDGRSYGLAYLEKLIRDICPNRTKPPSTAGANGSAPLADQRLDGCLTAAGMRKPRLHP